MSQFCIYNQKAGEWPVGQGDPLHKSNMVKEKCTIEDFQRALHARDPLGIGFDESAHTMLHLIWQLLAWVSRENIPDRGLSYDCLTCLVLPGSK